MTDIPDATRIRRQVLIALAVIAGGYLVLTRLGLDSEPDPSSHPSVAGIKLDKTFRLGASFCVDDLQNRMEADSNVLLTLKQKNFRDIVLLLPVWLPSMESGHLEYPSSALRKAGDLGARLREQGFKVTLRPWIWIGEGKNAADILQSDQVAVFQRSYRGFISELAPEASRGADILVLNAFGLQSHRGASAWIDLISIARTTFPGALAYVFTDSVQVQRFVFWNSTDLAVLEGPAIPPDPQRIDQWRVPPGLAIDLSTGLPPLHHVLKDFVPVPSTSGWVSSVDTLALPSGTRCLAVPEGRSVPTFRRSEMRMPGLDSFRPPTQEIRGNEKNRK